MMASHPPKPHLALAIGVIGYRLNRLPEQKRSGVITRIREVLNQMPDAARVALDQTSIERSLQMKGRQSH
jgi:hypothetical protein